MSKSLAARRAAWPCLVILLSVATNSAAQQVQRTTVLGALTGADAPQRPRGVRLFGTDLGWTFEHKGVLQILLGDSWAQPDALCGVLRDGFPDHDDTQGSLPLEYSGGVPELTIATQPDSLTEFAPTLIYRDAQLLRTSQNAGPMTAFSDGERAIAIYQATTFAACGARAACPAPLECSPRIGQCFPQPLDVPTNCDLATHEGCQFGQFCLPNEPGYCVDRSVPLADLSQRVALELELAVQRPDDPTRYDSRFTFYSNRFINMTARTIEHLAVHGRSDYRRGHGDLLLWGRPGFASDHRNNQPLYLLTHALPLQTDERGALLFRPRYFAGLDRAGQPIWSDAQDAAKPLALDGQRDGDPRELLRDLNQLSVTWLDAPIKRWVMFYGGGAPLSLTGPTTDAISGVAPGAVAVRFAEHPWGPWSPPETLLAPGRPEDEGALYGPGGFLYHPRCVDTISKACARSDPARYSALLLGKCTPENPSPDYGVLYGAGIIEPYTRRSEDGFDVHWTVSSWNPYVTLFVRSQIRARH
jgi:hypothetical protein